MSTIAQESLTRDVFEVAHDRTIRTEIDTFRERAAAFLAGQISDNDFRPFRLKHGIYGQRQAGVQMVRCKIPTGMMTVAQTEQLARIADDFAGGKCHLTTRQNVQFHFVPLASTADLMHALADVGLTNREACYNTVRNVTACPWAGLSPNEVFDVRPYAQKIAYAFLRKDLTGNLPRKFKFAFDGCADKDCVQGAINDVTLRAVIRDGKRGFRMTVGGGLGALPVEQQLLDEFVPEEMLIHKCEAVLRVFNRHGNRANKFKARLKFVMRERGFEWLKEQIEAEYREILAKGGIPMPDLVPEGFGGYQSKPQPLGLGALLPVVNTASSGDPDYDRWLETNVSEQKQTGYATVLIKVDQGNLTSAQLRGLARIAGDVGDGLVRTTVEQNLLMGFIPLGKLPGLYAALNELGLGSAGAQEIDDVVTCPGAYSCNLGITKAMSLGEALQQVVRDYSDPAVRALSIKISGCPNSCGHHWIGNIGFYGNARKLDGKEVPYYQMLLGGGHDEDGIMRFGLAVQSIPARLAPEAVRRVLDHFVANRERGEHFRQYVLRHKVETFRALTADPARPAELEPEAYQDWGDAIPCSLQLGRGE